MLSHEQYMDQALNLAAQAFAQNEVPIGALLIDSQGIVIGRGYNQTEAQHSQLMHAELQALREATDKIGDWRLDGATVYVTLEPCTMCFAALALSRVKRVVFGAYSPVFGFQLDKDCFLPLYNKDALFLQGGVKELECSTLLKQFFQKKRVQVEGNKIKNEP